MAFCTGLVITVLFLNAFNKNLYNYFFGETQAKHNDVLNTSNL